MGQSRRQRGEQMGRRTAPRVPALSVIHQPRPRHHLCVRRGPSCRRLRPQDRKSPHAACCQSPSLTATSSHTAGWPFARLARVAPLGLPQERGWRSNAGRGTGFRGGRGGTEKVVEGG